MPAALLALFFAILAAAGSLYLSLGMGLLACPLCFYQRTLAFAIIAVLLIGLLLPDRNPRILCVLALPLAVGGLGIAAFHTNLVLSGKLECPLGIAEIGSAPAQSLAIYTLILISLLAGVFRAGTRTIPAAVLAVALGGLVTYGSTVANPPAKKADKPLDDLKSLKTCQVPFSG